MTIRISLGTVLAALVLIAISAGTAVGVMLWEPWDGGDGEKRAEPTEPETPSGPQTSGTAAALKAQAWARDNFTNSFCEAEEFNEQTDAWITVCSYTRSGGIIRLRRDEEPPPPKTCKFRLKVSDSSGRVSIVEKNPSAPDSPNVVCN